MKKNIWKWVAMCLTAICIICAGNEMTGIGKVQAASVKLSVKSKTITTGQTFTLTLKNVKKSSSVKWSTSNKKIVSIKKVSKAKYKVTAKKEGKATITVKAGKKKYKCVVTVKAAAQSNGNTAPGKETEEKHVHAYNEAVEYVLATCTEEGYDLYRCACGETKKENIEKPLGHTWDHYYTITKNPTDSEKGTAEHECSVCHEKETREITIQDLYEYTIDPETDTVTIELFHWGSEAVAEDKSYYGGKVEIPETIEGKTVAALGTGDAVICGDNVVSIKIPECVDYLEKYVFAGCTNLEEVNLPEGIPYVPDSAFSYCRKLKHIEIPKSAIYIKCWAFRGCKSLESIDIPDNITAMGFQVFWECENLKEINLSKNTIKLYYGMFQGCTSLKAIDLPEGMEEIRYQLFEHCTSLKSVVVPNSVKVIQYSAFKDCTSLEKVVIPATVEVFEEGIFENCPNVTVYVTAGSKAEEYVKDAGVPYVVQ